MSSTRDISVLSSSDLCNIEALAEASLRQQDVALSKVRVYLDAGIDLEEIYLNRLVPTAHLLGSWWLSDRIGFAEVTLAIHSLQRIVYELSPQFLQGCDQKFNGYRAIFLTTPGSQHSFGTVMLSEFFKREGWTVSNASAEPADEVVRELSQQWFEVAGFSVSSDRGVEALRALILEARRTSLNPNVLFMVGGAMAELDHGLIATLGADLIGGDARDSERLAYHHVRNSKLAA